jgi:hypothetical protein
MSFCNYSSIIPIFLWEYVFVFSRMVAHLQQWSVATRITERNGELNLPGMSLRDVSLRISQGLVRFVVQN